jgi:hypothetical protein
LLTWHALPTTRRFDIATNIVGGPESTGLMELIPKMQHTDNYFVLLFKGWKKNDAGEDYADIELVVNGFRDKDDATIDDLSDFLGQIAHAMHE